MKSLALLLLSVGLHADTANLGVTFTAAPNAEANRITSVIQGQDGNGQLRQVLVGTDGKLQVATTTANQGLSITASPVMAVTSRSVEVWLTQTASVKSLTTAAGSANARCIVCLAPSFGGAGVRMAWGTGLTAPTDLWNIGIPIATSASAQCYGPFAPGINIYTQGSGAASVTGAQSVDEVR